MSFRFIEIQILSAEKVFHHIGEFFSLKALCTLQKLIQVIHVENLQTYCLHIPRIADSL